MINLSTEHLQLVRNILLKHVPNNEVWIFGSRITDKIKPYSDLDLVVISKFPLAIMTMALMKEEFSESNLPFKVDILDWTQITPEFKQVIETQHEVITPFKSEN